MFVAEPQRDEEPQRVLFYSGAVRARGAAEKQLMGGGDGGGRGGADGASNGRFVWDVVPFRSCHFASRPSRDGRSAAAEVPG